VQLGYVLDWLTEFYDHQTLKAMADLRVNDLMPLYTVPAGTDIEQHSNMTGQLLDMASNAKESVSVVVPFFSDAGVDTISESLAAASDREVSVELLTRDLTMGNEQNQPYIQSICAEIRAEGTHSQLSIYEFNKEEFPDSTLHAKMLLTDSSRAYIGSANMTESSLQSSLEAGIYLDGKAAAEIATGVKRFRESELFVDVTSEYKR
jgi:phosphatidylserine/phosphatidylglycerophosphate/cardiolipin synthase-like enzyme